MNKAEEANFIVGSVNGLLNKDIKKFIKKFLPSVQEFLTSKFTNDTKGALKVRKSKRRRTKGKKHEKMEKKKSRMKKKKSKMKQKKKGKKGGALSFFGKKVKTLEDVKRKIENPDGNNPLTKADAAVIISELDTATGQLVKNMILATEPPGFEVAVECFEKVRELQMIAIQKENEIKEEDIEDMKQNVQKEFAITLITTLKGQRTLIDEHTKTVAAAYKNVQEKEKTVTDNEQWNRCLKKIGNLVFIITIMVGIAVGIYSLYKFDVMVGKWIDWLLSFKATCKPGQSSYKSVGYFSNEKELVCIEPYSWYLGFLNMLHDMISSLAGATGEATDAIKYIAYVHIFLQQFGTTITAMMVVYTKLISMLREAGEADQVALDRAKKALKESFQISSMMIDNSEKIKLQLQDTPSDGNTKTGRVVEIEPVKHLGDVDGGGNRRKRNTLRRRKVTKKARRTRRTKRTKRH